MKLKRTFSKCHPNTTEDTEAHAPEAAFALKLCEAEGTQHETEASRLHIMAHLRKE